MSADRSSKKTPSFEQTRSTDSGNLVKYCLPITGDRCSNNLRKNQKLYFLLIITAVVFTTLTTFGSELGFTAVLSTTGTDDDDILTNLGLPIRSASNNISSKLSGSDDNNNANNTHLVALSGGAAGGTDVYKHDCSLTDLRTGLPRQYRVLIFLDSKFVDLFLNWLLFYREVCGNDNMNDSISTGSNSSSSSSNNLEVVCMESEGGTPVPRAVLKYYGIECSKNSFKSQGLGIKGKKLTTIWEHRINIIAQHLTEGMDIILTDSDALWMKSPFPDIEMYSDMYNSEIIASKGFSPWELAEKWGSCLCMGFIYFKASTFTIDVFGGMQTTIRQEQELIAIKNEQIIENMEKIKGRFASSREVDSTVFKVDDQHMINRQLDAWNISWPRHMIIEGPKAHTGVIYRGSAPHTVTLLPHDQYVRYCLPTGVNWGKNTQVQHKILRQRTRAATIVHCQVASGRANTKEVFFYAFDLFKYNYSEFTGMPPNYIEAAQHDSFMRNRAKYHKSLYGGEAFQSRIRNREGLKGLPLRIRIASLKEDQLAVVKTQEKIVESNKASGGVVNSVMQFLKRLYE